MSKFYSQSSISCLLVISTVMLGMSSTACAHSGGLNSQGCHAGSRPYHCHRSSNEMVGNRLRCDLGSRSSECVGNRKYYSSHKSTQSRASDIVSSYQKKLMKHCKSLPSNFVDGVHGPATTRALKNFQIAYMLDPDGKYGPKTAMALNGEVTGACK